VKEKRKKKGKSWLFEQKVLQRLDEQQQKEKKERRKE